MESCPVCLDEYDPTCQAGEIHAARCGHSIHKKCIQTLIRTGAYSCPICRMPFGDIPQNVQERKLIRYLKMLRQNLPAAAVRQRMEVDGIAPDAIDAFFTGGASENIQDSEPEKIAPTRDTEKFARMLRIGMGEGAIRQKMAADSFTAAEIDAFFAL